MSLNGKQRVSMTTTNEANRQRLKNRPGIILEFDPPRWDYEEAADTIGRVYTENGLTIYKLPGDLPEDTDLETIEPVAINPDGTVQQWFYTRTSNPEADTIENQNRKLGEERAAEGFYDRSRQATPVPLTPVRKRGRFDRELLRFQKSVWFSTKVTTVAILVMLIGWGINWGINRLTTSGPKQVTVRLAMLPVVGFQYTLTENQVAQQIKTISLPLTLEANGEATGTVELPDAKAKGIVRFLNSRTTTITLPAGTLIASANGISYKLVQSVTVPGANFQAAKFGFIDTIVQADQAGPQGNLPGGIGEFGFGTLTVAGQGPVSGGTNRTVKVVTAEDITRLKTKLQGQANTEATASFDQKLAPEQKRWGVVEPGRPEFTLPEPNSEQPSSQFKGTLILQLNALSYRPDELLKLVIAPPSVSGLPLEYGPALGGELGKDALSNFSLSYTRTLKAGKLAQPLSNWQGSRPEFEKYLTELKNKPGLKFVGISGDLPPDWQGQVQANFQFN